MEEELKRDFLMEVTLMIFEHYLAVGEAGMCEEIANRHMDLSNYPLVKKKVDKYLEAVNDFEQTIQTMRKLDN